ncbi:MAG: Bacteroidetes-specific putative membrane protein [Bacteroidetes bacterium]|nr:MAG: Bacteroidetes-specific putative membrane protein [Bacteroidota bacterium]
MRKTLTTLGLAMIGFTAMAQQDPQFTQYMFNKLFTNPGYSGYHKSLCGTVIGRQQWSGFDGAPTTFVVSIDAALGAQRNHGLGVNLMFDKLGFEATNGYRLNYAYHLPLMSGQADLGIGIEVGAISKTIGPTGSNSWLATQNWQTDPSIPPLLKKTTFDLGFGLYFSTQKIHFGIASTHLAAQDIADGSQSVTVTPPTSPPTVTHNLVYALARHYFINGGYDWWIDGGTGDWILRPSFLVKSDASITQFDLNVNILMKQRIWAGATYRLQDAIAPTIGYQQPFTTKYGQSWLKIGLAYDVTTSALKSYNNGTYEAVLNYCHPLGKTPKIEGHEDVRNFF